MLSLIDLVNRAYLRTINPDVWIVSGVQYMPLVGEDSGYIMRTISVIGASLYPLALSLLLPIFMYTIVLEKEEKLLEMMKMNGMRMQVYWAVTYLFFPCLLFDFLCILPVRILCIRPWFLCRYWLPCDFHHLYRLGINLDIDGHIFPSIFRQS